MKHKNKKEFYERQYTKGETKGPAWYQALAPFVRDREMVAADLLLSQSKPAGTLLDIGAGEGNLLRNVSPHLREAVGIDIAPNRIKLAKKLSKNYKNIRYQIADIDEKLPFKNNHFSLIACLGVLEYSFDPYFTLNEIKRVLKPQGTLVLEVPNLAFLPERIKLLFGKLPSWPDASGWQGGRLHNFTFESLKWFLESEGFSVKKMSGSGFLYTIRSVWPSLLSGDIIIVAEKK